MQTMKLNLDPEQVRIIWTLLNVELYKLEEDPHGMTYMLSQVREAIEQIENSFKLLGVEL
jgi:hypothetical protein